ncbi:MAG: DegT/DnrJ/EryC1/StrS family aminotransferase [Candidatus Omnitrophica bacterium]|nr:DegT/DnrJ/EryC1/StrS family aminotransferase [Candidatus Omnitrophota bacterium]
MRPSGLEEKLSSAFRVGFDRRDTQRLLAFWEKILASERWTEGPFTEQFESAWQALHGLRSVATASWAGAALAALNYIDVRGETVLCPSNTFMATPLSVAYAGGKVEWVDCNRNDLCLSYEDFVRKAEASRPKAAWVVHIGGHIAFEIEKIADYCRERRIWLLEDCAHAHGAQWRGKRPGAWGDAGIYSFYATKTISTGEGGMLVTRHGAMAESAKGFRNYGKPAHAAPGLNFRMSEFTAALGVVQTQRLDEIAAGKRAYAEEVLDPQHPNRVLFPEGMISGYYKYIVFGKVEPSTGRVYDKPCHRIMGQAADLPNTDWVTANHSCVPIYYGKDHPAA